MSADYFARVCKLAAALPGVEEGTSYNTRALKVRGKLLCRLKEDGETLVVRCGSMDEKEFLLDAEPEIFYETDHYKGWPAFLVRLAKIDDARLFQCLEQIWLHEAGKKLIAARALAVQSC